MDIRCLFIVLILAHASAGLDASLQSCKTDAMTVAKLSCGIYPIQVSTAVIGYSDQCRMSSANSFSCPRNVSSDLGKACDGHSTCTFNWVATECLGNCTGNQLNSLDVNYSCIEDETPSGNKIINDCSDWSLSPTTSSTQWSTETDTTPFYQGDSMNQTSSESSGDEPPTTAQAPSWSPAETTFSTPHTISDVQTSKTESVTITEKSVKDLIIYAAGGGGAGCILIVLLIGIMCCCIRRRKHDTTSKSSKDHIHLENGVQMTTISDNRNSEQNSVVDKTTHTEVHHDMYAPVTKSASLMKPNEKEANYVYSSRDKPEVPPKLPGIGTMNLDNSSDKDSVHSEGKREGDTYESFEKAHQGQKLTDSVTTSKHYINLLGVNNSQYHDPLTTGVSENQCDTGSANNNQLEISFMSGVSESRDDITPAEHSHYDIPLNPGLSDNQYDAPLMSLVSNRQNDTLMISSDESTPVSSGDSNPMHIQVQDYAQSYAKTSGDNIISRPSVRNNKISNDVAPGDDLEYDYADMQTTEGSLMDTGHVETTAQTSDKNGGMGTSDDYSDVEIQNSPRTSIKEKDLGGCDLARVRKGPERTDVQSSEIDEKEENTRDEENDASPEGTILVENDIYNN